MDIFDLNDWTATNHPEFFNAIRYLHEGVRYDAMKELWEKKTKLDNNER
tara:strand:+ start:100 stop:246 length:147 start_codon:yes stop_codon:yes gene_type:complete